MITPYPLQQKMIDFHEGRYTSYNFSETGSGKTVVAGGWLKNVVGLGLFVTRKVSAHQISCALQDICPAHNVVHWHKDWTFDPKAKDLIVVTHYEHVKKLPKAMQFDQVVLDECHLVKTASTQRTKAIRKLVKSEDWLCMSATPTHRNWELEDGTVVPDPGELFATLQIMNPSSFSSYWRWHNTWLKVRTNRDTGHKEVVDFKHSKADAYVKMLEQFSISYRKADIRADVPGLTNVVVRLADQRFYSTYKKFEDHVRKEIMVATTDGPQLLLSNMAEMVALRRYLSDPRYYDQKAPQPKQEWLRAFIEDGGGSFIIFTNFIDSRTKIARFLREEMGLDVAVIDSQYRGDFSEDYFVTTIPMGAGSFDLPHIENAIFWDIDWSTIRVNQCRDRIDRISQSVEKTAYFLMMERTFDYVMMASLQNKFGDASLREAIIRYFGFDQSPEVEITF